MTNTTIESSTNMRGWLDPLQTPERELIWLLDRDRFDDALIWMLYINARIVPRREPDERLERMITERRIERNEDGGYVLGPNSGIEVILGDLAESYGKGNDGSPIY